MKSKFVISMMLAFALGFSIAWIIAHEPDSERVRYSSVFLRDTVYEIIPQKSIQIKAKAKVEFRDSAKIETQAFEASIDTVVAKDSIHISYCFPENSIYFKLSAMPDTIAKYNLMLFETEPRQENVWLSRLGYFASGLVGGYIISRIK